MVDIGTHIKLAIRDFLKMGEKGEGWGLKTGIGLSYFPFLVPLVLYIWSDKPNKVPIIWPDKPNYLLALFISLLMASMVFNASPSLTMNQVSV